MVNLANYLCDHSLACMSSGSFGKMITMLAFTAICTLLLTTAAAFGEGRLRHNISLIVMAPFPDGELTKGWMQGPSLYPAAVVAAREVNNNSDILPGFNLELIKVDSGCSELSKVAISFCRDIYENKDHQVVGIIGPGCSESALEVSYFARRNEVSLIHITPSATSPELEDPSKNTTFATISSALLHVENFIQLMNENQWDNVATLQDEGRAYSRHTHAGFIKAVDSKKVVFTGNLFKGDDVSLIPLDGLQSSRARVVLVFAGLDTAVELLCYAFHRRMVFPNYQWIFHDRGASELVKVVEKFRVNGKDIKCTRNQMIAATEGIILNEFNLKRKNTDIMLPLFQKTYDGYYEDYCEELNGTDPPIDFGNSYHDAVWAMALALHNASTNGVDLTSYTYNRNNDTKVIAQYLSQVQFEGTLGLLSFRNGTRSAETIINIKQVSNGTEQLIGTFDSSQEVNLNLSAEENGEFIGDLYYEQHVKIHVSVGIVLMLLTIVLIVVIFLLQLLNTFRYNYHSIKATSPNLTHLVFSGCYLFSIALLILSIQETFLFSADINHIAYAVLCNMFSWCFLVGFSLIFVTVCAKIWRVYRLFKHFSNDRPGHYLSDNSLIAFVMLFLAVDIIICTTWNLLDPWTTKLTLEPSLHGTPLLFVRSECTCQHITQWVVAIALYKGTILLLLVVLSILNRRIKRKDFRHTRKINILIYGITMLIGVGAPLYFLLKHISIYIGYSIVSTILLSTLLLCILTLFLPPVLASCVQGNAGQRAAISPRPRPRRHHRHPSHYQKYSCTVANSMSS